MIDEEIPTLVEQYHALLVRFAAGRIGYDGAEDAVQEVWLRLWEQVQAHATLPETIKPWLYRVLVNHLIDLTRRARLRPTVELLEADGVVADWEDTRLEWEEGTCLVRRLHAEWRVLLCLKASGYSYAELCQRFHLSESAAKEQVYRARQQVQAWREKEAS